MKGRVTKQKDHCIPETPSREGRDELNLAEFPIASLSSRPATEQKTLHFEDRIWDKGLGRHVTRKLTITASDHFGLPTALDDEVVLGLIQLTRQNDFRDKRVFFSRYELIRLLGWRNEGKSYSRLETSLKRWLGVTFYYENAWWDKRSDSWVNESFHLLERVSILATGRRSARDPSEPALSSFLWNEVVFGSFQAGYLKRIDMELFRSLKSPIAKRLYRFLDKRFHHKTVWEFELRELAHEHIGLSRSYDTAQLKRKLLPAIGELEGVGFVREQESANRFTRIKRGVWHVSLEKPRTKARSPQASASPRAPIRDSLLRHGVNRRTADKLVADHSPDAIEHHVRVLEWLLAQPGVEKPRNAAGYLVQSIREGYDVPRGFQQSASRRNSTRQPPKNTSQSVDTRIRKQVTAHIKGLSGAERDRLEHEALASAEKPMLEAYHRAQSRKEPILTDMYRRLILEQHVAGTISKRRGR
jgi:plasmid replication initiation protein